MKKSSNGVDSPQKGIWYGRRYLDNRLSQNVHCSRQSHKFYQGNNEKLEWWIESRRKTFYWGKNPERYNPGRCTNIIITCNSDDTTQSYTEEIPGVYKFTTSQEKASYLIYRDNIKLFAKCKKEPENLYTGSEDIRPGYRNGILHGKMCYANNGNRKATNDRRNRTIKYLKKSERSENINLQIPWDIESGHNQLNGGWRKM